jgi:hypothetical protein
LNGRILHLCHENYGKMTNHYSFHHHNRGINKSKPLFIMFIYAQQIIFLINNRIVKKIHNNDVKKKNHINIMIHYNHIEILLKEVCDVGPLFT